MGDWEDQAFVTRHMHNRASRPLKHSQPFNIRKAFGQYNVKCPKAASHPGSSTSRTTHRQSTQPKIDIFRPTKDGSALLGRITFPNALNAYIVLAGSRQTLHQQVTQHVSPRPRRQENSASRSDPDSDSSSQASKAPTADDEANHYHHNAFEKNTFRAPKFWLQFESSFNGSGSGYLVFSGNDCRRFKGTLTCASRGWNNILIEGWKTVGMSERDEPFYWASQHDDTEPLQ